ncbi:hypothetical protein [Sphingobium sp. CFD-2]|uniref:hypothetical protein n=1 Tax=Sphingobium sp. CFD-2 TaxID=2878542 RepID=UPI00214B44AE|nr:hypothetical protein [Sphingobium sp. CFD-2]
MEQTPWQLELAQADMEMEAAEREKALRDICRLVRRHEVRLQELIACLLEEGSEGSTSEATDRPILVEPAPLPKADIHCSLLAHIAFASKILPQAGRPVLADAINDR